MSSLPSFPIRLKRLSRSTLLAGLLLLVSLMRVGMVMACAPHDIAESLVGGAHAVVATQGIDGSWPDEPSAESVAGHCLHCACHFSAALPATIVALPAAAGQDMQAHLQIRRDGVCPDRDLRPPIL